MAKRIIGIHIDDYRIICSEARIGGGIAIEKLAVATLSPGIVQNGIIGNPAEVSETLSELLAGMEVTTANAIVNIPTNLTQIKCIPIEKNYLASSPDQMEWELSHHINEPMEYFQFSYSALSGTYILVGVRQYALTTRTQALEKAGLLVTSADPDPIALFNLFSIIEGAKSTNSIAIVDIQLPFSQIVFFARGEFGFGGTIFTPPELFGIGNGLKTWREFSDDLTAAVLMATKSQEIFNPVCMTENIVFTGRTIKDDIAQTIASKAGLNLLEFRKLSKKRTKVKPKKTGLEPTELSITLGLAAHGTMIS